MRNALLSLLLCLCLGTLVSCRKATSVNAVSSGVPMINNEKEEDHFDPNYRPKDDGSDNLRGLDPAWEDDMDDMGMTRYQENNDEEGWE